MELQEPAAFGIIIGCSIFGILWGMVNICLLRSVDMDDYSHLVPAKGKGESKQLLGQETTAEEARALLEQIKLISHYIEDGAITFLKEEYTFLAIFITMMAALLFFTAEPGVLGTCYTTVAFLIGGITSICSGYIGMRVAVYTNVRTTKECAESIGKGFVVAFRGGEVLGFTLVGMALLVLCIIIIVYKQMYITATSDFTNYREMFEMIAGYGLGGSTVALFGRVGGGIYTKAADVGSDLAGKVI